MRRAALAVFLALLGGCAAEPRCGSPSAPMLRAELFFGRDGVSDEAWDAFVRDELTAAFPAGLTILPARGQWRDPGTGALLREPSAVVLVLLDPAEADPARLAAVAEAYKRKHAQQSVGVSVTPACASF